VNNPFNSNRDPQQFRLTYFWKKVGRNKRAIRVSIAVRYDDAKKKIKTVVFFCRPKTKKKNGFLF
jgi:hypothetical protein